MSISSSPVTQRPSSTTRRPGSDPRPVSGDVIAPPRLDGLFAAGAMATEGDAAANSNVRTERRSGRHVTFAPDMRAGAEFEGEVHAPRSPAAAEAMPSRDLALVPAAAEGNFLTRSMAAAGQGLTGMFTATGLAAAGAVALATLLTGGTAAAAMIGGGVVLAAAGTMNTRAVRGGMHNQFATWAGQSATVARQLRTLEPAAVDAERLLGTVERQTQSLGRGLHHLHARGAEARVLERQRQVESARGLVNTYRQYAPTAATVLDGISTVTGALAASTALPPEAPPAAPVAGAPASPVTPSPASSRSSSPRSPTSSLGGATAGAVVVREHGFRAMLRRIFAFIRRLF